MMERSAEDENEYEGDDASQTLAKESCDLASKIEMTVAALDSFQSAATGYLTYFSPAPRRKAAGISVAGVIELLEAGAQDACLMRLQLVLAERIEAA